VVNKYPLWKNIWIACCVIVAALYAVPNLFSDDYAIQVKGVRGAQVTEQTYTQIQKAFHEQGLIPKKYALLDNRLEVRFQDSDQQLKAKTLLQNLLSEKYITALNFAPTTPSWLESIGAKPMRLGLDLRGGIHFLMEVDMQEVLAKAQTQIATDVRSTLREARVRYAGMNRRSQEVLIHFRDEATRDEAETLLTKTYRQYKIKQVNVFDLRIYLSEEELKLIREDAITQNITIIRNRVNELGVAEPLVQRQGAERIIVQLPGVQDPSRAKQILGATATLEFRMVNTQVDIDAAMRGRVPSDSELFDVRSGSKTVLEKKVILSGDHITNARAAFDEYGQAQVSIDLDASGGSLMSDATKSAVGKVMATLFTEYRPTQIKDKNGRYVLKKVEEVVSQATIQSRLGRSFRITGVGYEEAKNLAILLRAGALKAPIQIVEERTIGPSMGQQNIENGLTAMIWGLIAVVVFMAIYYRQFGFVANVVLMLNLVMIIGVLSMIPGATLTLPGIAGIVLTVGMAVDGNVLIFERIREELREGRSVQRAISEGYSNAFSTITDANITTFVTSLILFAIGTGAVKGFAVTLMIGILTSMFTVIVVSRALVNMIWGGKRLDKLSI
jgi:preprotein translocase subunit SecD